MKVPDFVRWMKQYEDLPLLHSPPTSLDDDTIDFQCDMSYCDDLLSDIEIQARRGGTVQPFPIVLSDELEHALVELAGIKDHIRELSREFRHG